MFNPEKQSYIKRVFTLLPALLVLLINELDDCHPSIWHWKACSSSAKFSSAISVDFEHRKYRKRRFNAASAVVIVVGAVRDEISRNFDTLIKQFIFFNLKRNNNIIKCITNFMYNAKNCFYFFKKCIENIL